jgi:hypothetical protein
VKKPTRRELVQTLVEICNLTANPVTGSGVEDFISAVRLIDKVWLLSFDIVNREVYMHKNIAESKRV